MDIRADSRQNNAMQSPGDAPLPLPATPLAAATPPARLASLDPNRRASVEAFVLCGVATIALALQELMFLTVHFNRNRDWLLPDAVKAVLPGWPVIDANLSTAWWVLGTLLIWVLVPLLVGRALGFGARDLGLGFPGVRKLLPYALILGGFLPVVYFACHFLPGFKERYPLYAGLWTWRAWLLYELLYGLQFFSVEFFFRGFLVNGLGRSFGYRAVFVAMVPYVMVHFHKPLTEALAAVLAGLILGTFALRTRSIWGGLLLHLGVAWSMDLFAVWAGRLGGAPTVW